MRSLILVLAMAMAGIAPPRHPVAAQPAWQADAPAAARANAGTVGYHLGRGGRNLCPDRRRPGGGA